MSRKDEEQYWKKHPPGTAVSEAIASEVKQKAQGGELFCTAAFEIATAREVPAGEIGVALDLLGIRITQCQLGLFGYGAGVKMLQKTTAVAPELEKAIRAKLVNGRLPCVAAWETGAQLGVPRLGVSSACEALGIKIKPCQLGAF